MNDAAPETPTTIREFVLTMRDMLAENATTPKLVMGECFNLLERIADQMEADNG